ncbi:MAG: acyl-CoA dehydrogenase family protein [Bacteroidales bacterium]|nr:acyl-CoA dehydrogenase family protein [Bacteroidales bacterium]
MADSKELKGGEFLVKETLAKDIFIPEEFDEEQKMIAQTCNDFIDAEIVPILDRIDAQEPGLMRSLVQKSGELGLLGIAIPEEYMGFNQSYLTTMLANEAIGAAYSFSVAYMAHTGIGTLPILYYGNEEQKQRYIPDLATGARCAAYCLTEPGAGSDANAGTTKAVLSEDGKHYILNGQKMWITNGGFADVLTVFAKIDNDRVLSAFIVETAYEGVVINPEEKKMGIKGSSTTQIFFNDVKVPVENLLGQRGEGFRIAINILHIGRIKLGATVIGGCKRSVNHSVNYANERKQFGSLISNYGAIKHKLAEQVIRTFVTESSVYRATVDVEKQISKYQAEGMDYGRAIATANQDFQVECAMLKVLGSEALDYIVDEAVQIYGGMGFSAEAPVDRAYRDSRINRIFEGTNEINRLWAGDNEIKQGLKGFYKLKEAMEEVKKEINNLKEVKIQDDYFADKLETIKRLKKAAILIITGASDKFEKQISSQQEIIMNIADMLIGIYSAESAILRVQKMESLQIKSTDLYRDMIDLYTYDTAHSIAKFAHDALYSFADEKDAEKYHNAIHLFTKVKSVNVLDARRRIADKLIDENKYCF